MSGFALPTAPGAAKLFARSFAVNAPLIALVATGGFAVYELLRRRFRQDDTAAQRSTFLRALARTEIDSAQLLLFDGRHDPIRDAKACLRKSSPGDEHAKHLRTALEGVL